MDALPRSSIALLVLHFPIAALADEPVSPAPPQTVHVSGALSDTDARRHFVAGKVIIGRKRIADSGLRRVEELLKREPSVTVSADGRIGLLNLPGYTQILIDGRAPVGQTPGEIDLIHVERIEIVKGSIAEFGAFSIAGTINIVTRAITRKTETNISTGIARKAGKLGADLQLSNNIRAEGSPFRFNQTLSINAKSHAGTNRTWQTITLPGEAEVEQWRGGGKSRPQSRAIDASVGWIWQRSSDETIQISPRVSTTRGRDIDTDSRLWNDGTGWDALELTASRMDVFTLPVTWTFKPTSKSEVEVSAHGAALRSKTSIERFDGGPRIQQSGINDSDVHADSTSLDVVYRTRLNGAHEIKFGARLGTQDFDIDAMHSLNGLLHPAANLLNPNSSSRNRTNRMFIQDEWRVNDSVAFNAGIARQESRTVVKGILTQGRNHFQLWSPSLHMSYKIGADENKQLRIGMARSFKNPDDDALALRATINPWAPCSATSGCGANTLDTTDSIGDMAVRPERAATLDLSYEHGIGDDSQITLSLFRRRIKNKIGSEIVLADVPWAQVQRYLERPANLGSARSTGASVEVDIAMEDLFVDAPKLVVRGSADWTTSNVDSIPGPDNRLDKQPPWSAKLGGTYKMTRMPVTIDINCQWTPALSTRTSLSERVVQDRKFEFDAGVKWKLAKAQRLSLSWKTSLPKVRRTLSQYLRNDQVMGFYGDTPRWTTFRVQLESDL